MIMVILGINHLPADVSQPPKKNLFGAVILIINQLPNIS